MIKQLIFVIQIILIGIFVSFSSTAQKKDAPKPNIIFILTDDLGVGDVGVFFQNQRRDNNKPGDPWELTPNIDKIALEGAKLTQNYCNASVCAPSRASLLLGVNQGHSNVRDNQFDKALENNYTVANVLKKAGYATAVIGKWGLQGDNRWDKNGNDWPAHPLNRGFDYFFGYMRHSDGHEHYPKEGVYRGSKEVYENRKNITPSLDKCYTGDLWTTIAKKWIVDQQKRKKDEPFFMYLAYDTPHAVLELPTQAFPAGKGLNGGLQWLGKSGNMINTASGKVDSWIYPEFANATYDNDKNSSTPEVPWPDVYKRYATGVQRIDEEVGDLMQLLKDLKIDDNTIVVFTSDNGPSVESYLKEDYSPQFFKSYGHFDGIKRDTWEGGVRMPTLIKWPAQIKAGKVVHTPGISSDWMATFLDAAGFPVPVRSDGVSLLPSLTGKGTQRESLVYIEYFQDGKTPEFKDFEPQRRNAERNQMQLIRFGDYVGVRYDIKSASDDFEIYNVVKDPKEISNLANRPEMISLQKQMKAKVLQVRRPDPNTPRPYDSALIPAVTSKNIVTGLSWQAYEGTFPWVPSTVDLKPVMVGKSQHADPNCYKFKNGGVLQFKGFISIPADGEYTFYLAAEDGAFLKIHEASVIDADYGNKGQEKSGAIRLKAGLHPLNLYYKKAGSSISKLTFQWKGPDIIRQEIPQDVFRR